MLSGVAMVVVLVMVTREVTLLLIVVTMKSVATPTTAIS